MKAKQSIKRTHKKTYREYKTQKIQDIEITPEREN